MAEKEYIEYGYIFKDEDISDAADATAFACAAKRKPITNADRIRAMTDEELADWLGVYCNGQTAQEVGKPCVSGMGSCEECWLDWLKQEVTANDS